MCGIVGTINCKKQYNIKNILNTMDHRGPDDNGYYKLNDSSFLGHTRLSILDTSNHGHQPMVSDCGNYVIVYNGEVYNHNELRAKLEKKGYVFHSHADTEVILKLYIDTEDKKIFLNKLRGMFAFCIYDKINDSYFFARDRFGIKPLLYFHKDDELCFSSELKPLIENRLVSNELDKEALEDYIQYGSIVQPKTIYKNVKHLMPSHYMIFDKNGLKIEKYYSLIDNITKLNISYEEAVKLTREKLEEATKYHMVSDVEVGAFLSGGVDSTATVALMQKYSDKNLSTFSIGFSSSQKEVVDELSIAKKTSEILKTNHHEIVIDEEYIANIFDDFIDSMDQPSVDGINTYIVSKETSKELKVAISGLGGDEIFAGYPHFAKFSQYPEDEKNLIKQVFEELNKIRPNRFTDRFQYAGLSVEQRVDKIRTLDQTLYKDKPLVENKSLSKVQRISLAEIERYLLNILLRDSDNFSMANSLELRPVLLDHELVEFALSLDDDVKVGKNYLKEIFIESVRDIIPDFVFNREKSGFVMPVATWMNGVLNDRFKKLLDKQYDDMIDFKNFDNLRERVLNKQVKTSDWKSFLLLSWLSKVYAKDVK